MKADPQAFSDGDFDAHAEQLADAFKPAWDTPDLEATAVSPPPDHPEEPAVVSSTMVMERPASQDAPAVSIAPVVSVTAAPTSADAPTEKAPIANAKLSKQTVIGMAAPPAPLAALALSTDVTPREVKRPAPSSEAVEADQILESAPAPANLPFSSATSSPNVAGAAAGAGVYTMGMGTQVMNNRPVPSRPPAAVASIGSLPGSNALASRPPQPRAAAAVTADPFQTRAARPESSSDFDAYKPRKSNKAVVIGVIGVMALIGLGVGLKALISDDATDKPRSEPLVTGPAATTAEIPPPPPPSETATATAASTATAAGAAKTAEPATTAASATAPAATATAIAERPTPLATPPQHAAAPAAAPPAPRNDPPVRAARPSAPPPPPPAPAAKSPPKPANGGIVRDNPF